MRQRSKQWALLVLLYVVAALVASAAGTLVAGSEREAAAPARAAER